MAYEYMKLVGQHYIILGAKVKHKQSMSMDRKKTALVPQAHFEECFRFCFQQE